MSSVDTEKAKAAAVPPPLETEAPGSCRPADYSSMDVVLRILLLGSTLTAVVVMVTSKQTELITLPAFPFPVPNKAKFQHSPAFIYFVAALSIVCLYSFITVLGSFLFLSKPGCSTKTILYFAFLDVLMLGLAVSATGTAGGVAYIGLKGNSHVMWTKICNVYDKFCRHVGGSIAVALFASFLLVLLVWLSLCTLHSRIRK